MSDERLAARYCGDDMTPALSERLREVIAELDVSYQDGLCQDERLGRTIANLRWLIGERI